MKYRVQPTTLHSGAGFFIVDGATDQQVPGTGFYTLAGERDARNLCGQLNAAYTAGAASAPKLSDSALADLRAFLRLRITTTQMYGTEFKRLELAHNDVWVLQELVERVAARELPLVAAAREVIRTELFFQDHPQKFAAQKALRAALVPFDGAAPAPAFTQAQALAAYTSLRKYNSSIPDEALDAMRAVLLAAAGSDA